MISSVMLSRGKGGPTRFEITVLPVILLHITVLPAVFFLKVRFFVSVTWFKY